MENHVKSLQVVLFTVEDRKPRTILTDTLSYNPGYRAGDVIHVVHRPQAHQLIDNDRQYVVLKAKHVITTGQTKADPNDHILLIEVAELEESERIDHSELALSPIHMN